MKRSCSTFEDRKKVLFIKYFPFIFRIPGKDLTPSLCQLQQSPGLRLRSCHCPRHPQRSRTPVMTSLCHDYASVCHRYVSVSYWHCYVSLWWLWQCIKSICHDYVTLVWIIIFIWVCDDWVCHLAVRVSVMVVGCSAQRRRSDTPRVSGSRHQIRDWPELAAILEITD